MDNSQQPLATESFSYSWLTNQKPSFDGLLQSLRPSSVDFSSAELTVHDMVHQLNKIFKDDQDFDFNVSPGSRSSLALVDADEIFAEGCIKPVFPNRNKRTKNVQASTSLPATPLIHNSFSSRTSLSHVSSSRKCPKPSSSKLVLQKCYSLLVRPFCQGFGCSRKSIRVDDLERKVLEVRSRSNSQQASPDRPAVVDVCRSLAKEPETKSWSNCNSPVQAASSPAGSPSHYADIESSINEAILHCKRSFGNREV